MREIFPSHGQELQAITEVSAGPLPPAVAELSRLYRNVADPQRAGRQWLRANMVASTDGAVTVAGRSGGLSGPADRMIFAVLRSLADVIVVGAGTARAERYRPVNPASLWGQLRPDGAPPPPVAVVSASLRLAGCDALLTMPPGPSQTIVITTAAAVARRKPAIGGQVRLIEAGDDTVDVTAALGALAGLGYRSVLTEGGPTLLGQFASAGLLDELCLTTSPILAAGQAGRIVAMLPGRPRADGAVRELSLAHVLADGSFLFSRYLSEGVRHATAPEG